MASNLTIRPLNTGFIPTKPLQYHFHFSAEPYLKDVPDEKIPLPDYAFLVEGGDRLVLVDAGMSWTERANEYHHPGSWQDEGQDIESMLRSVGYSCGDIDIVVLTHLHWDHSYYGGHETKSFSVSRGGRCSKSWLKVWPVMCEANAPKVSSGLSRWMFAMLFLAVFQTCSTGLWSGAYGGR